MHFVISNLRIIFITLGSEIFPTLFFPKIIIFHFIFVCHLFWIDFHICFEANVEIIIIFLALKCPVALGIIF